MSISSNTTEGAKAPLTFAKGDGMATYKAGARKVAPLHPGTILAGILEDNRISVNAAAMAIGVTRAALNNVCAGTSAISPDMALRIGTYLGNGPDIWINMQRDFDLWHARAKLAAELKKIKPLPRD